MNRIFESIKETSCRWFGRAGFWYAILACYTLVLGSLSLNPWIRPVSRNEILSPDKLDHALAYGGLTIILFFCITRFRQDYLASTGRVWVAAIMASTLFGAFIEVAQSLFTRNRTGSMDDAVSNAIGACLGFIAYRVLRLMREKSRRPKLE